MRVSAIVLVIAMVVGARAAAIEQSPLPVVDLTTREGAIIRSDRITRTGTWVIVYVHSGCGSCEALLSAVEHLDVPDGTARVAIIAETADSGELAGLVARFPRLASAQWLADMTGVLGERVAPQAASALLGLRGTTIEWSVTGIVTESTQVKSLVTAWLNR